MAFIGKFSVADTTLVWDGSKFISQSLDSIVHSRAADKAAEYLVLSNTASLDGERALALGPGLISVDGGANGLFELSASLTAGPGIVINPNGQTLEISSSLNVDASFVVLGGEPSMPNERVLTPGVGLGILDNGPNGTVVLSASLSEGFAIDITQPNLGDNTLEVAVDLAAITGELDETYAHISGAFILAAADGDLPESRALVGGDGISLVDGGAGDNMTVELDAAAGPGIAINFNGGVAEFSASLAAGPGIAINDNGGVLEISSSVPTFDNEATYLVLNATSSLENERALTLGLGLSGSDGGAGGDFEVAVEALAGPGIVLGQTGNALTISSSFKMPVTQVSTNYTALDSDVLIAVDSTGGAVTITLPDDAEEGRKYIVKDRGGLAAEENITIVVENDTYEIDGGSEWILGINRASVTLVFDGTEWMTV